MQLVKLEIKGFKSFGDKVSINFNDGVTGIVGPNGCGKSNIVDAIRWVLGEQRTKALRSDKMDNVIFNGTKRRKPLQMAEVSLTFDNTKNLIPTEYTQVQITRRYYRSGESEYLLNGVTCRLKDINELFLDTGIGSDSYAIIELKMIDDILNDKDNSRRALFEEAAGISKFKVRKKQTLKKLDDTDKDLERVEDILYEIEKNLKTLEKQAKQAEKYFKYREEQKKYAVQLAKISIEEKQLELEKLNKQITELQDQKTKQSKSSDVIIAKIEKLKTELLQKEQVLASRQKTLNDFVNELRQQESDKKVKNERIVYLKEKQESLKQNVKTDNERVEEVEAHIKTLEETLEGNNKILLEIEAKVESLQADYDKQKENNHEFQTKFNERNHSLKEQQEKVNHLKNSIEVNEIRLKSLKEEINKADSNSENQSKEIETTEELLQSLAKQLNEKNALLDDLEKKETEHQTQMEDLNKQITTIKDDLSAQNRVIDSKQNEFNLTQSLVENLEGFPEAIKFLKKNTAIGERAPLLSDIISCPDELRIPLENFLENYMNYYIVENSQEAVSAISVLSEASKGKANFFVLDLIIPTKKNSSKIKGCTPIVDLIEYEAKYVTLIEHLLNNVHLSNNEDIPSNTEATIISKSGKTVKRSFTYSGGSVGLFEGKKIGRKKNLEKLEKEIAKLTSKRDETKIKLEKTQAELERVKNQNIEEQIKTAQHNINETNREYVGVHLKLEQLQVLVKQSKSKKEDLEKNIVILQKGIESSLPKLELENVQLEDLENKLEQLSEQLNTQGEMLSEKSSAYNQENILLHQQRNKIDSVLQEINFKKDNINERLTQVKKNAEQLTEVDQEIIKLYNMSESSDEEILAKYDEKEAIEKGVNEAEKAYYKIRGTISSTEEELKNENSGKNQVDTLILETQTAINEIKLALTSIKERLSVEFNTNINQLNLEEEEEITMNSEELEEKVRVTKERIQKMGPINSMAMEAYEDIKKRYDFITNQRKDLIEAKDSLANTIKEIDQVAKENFVTAFADIREHFMNVFRSLFTEEDQCDLTLTDPDNPLDSKIDIIAKPKGKRPLTINQLSGGEKTLTAVALLFSIYLIKPAPFCIFDEVDAPLDDANIDKFNKIIRKFSNESQFIIVTHNKRTMSTTDVIYGVTMQETGVSRLVPVDLRNLEESLN